LARLLVGEFISSVGDWLYLVAMLVVVYEITGDPVLLGVVGAARLLPYLFLSIPAGIVADRFDRRLVLLSTDIIRGLLMLVIAGLVSVNASALAIIAVAVLATCASAFFGPVIGAYLPTVVGDEADLGPANSAWGTLDNLAFVVGPGLAGLLIALGGLTIAFLLNAASFAVVALVLLGLPSTKAGGREEAVAEERKDGAGGGPAPSWRAAAGVAAGPLVLDLATSFAGGGMNVLIVVIAVDVLAAGEAATGYLNAATGVGGVVAGLIAGGLVARRLDLPIIAGSVIGTLGFIALGLTRELSVALVAIAVALGAVLLLDIVNVTLVQRAVPDALRGRVMGIIQTTGTLAMAAGSFALPVVAGQVGVGPVIIGTGFVVAAVAGLALVLLRRSGVLERVAIDPARLAILRHSILGNLPPARLEAAAQRLLPVVVTPGEVIIEQDAPADRFYLIESGRYGVTQRDADGRQVSLRTMGPGEVFGEIGLLTAGVRTANVSAETQGRLWALDRDRFLELVSAGAGLSTRLLDLHRGVRVASD